MIDQLVISGASLTRSFYPTTAKMNIILPMWDEIWFIYVHDDGLINTGLRSEKRTEFSGVNIILLAFLIFIIRRVLFPDSQNGTRLKEEEFNWIEYYL